ncbi:Patatin-like phospholipase [Paracoccus solventivorans]|uniref:Patatin-like phospholipase n=1 Tax=Paracoccus solventivorans TaxID=53463 RepID=A0A1M7JUW1_9RHOB|nr:Patatin-like phospholipase [Paracoccus solventivorans]
MSLGLGAGLSGRELQDLYVERGDEVFPPPPSGFRGRLRAVWRNSLHYLHYRYDRVALETLLRERLGAGTLLGSSKVRLIVPAFDGRHSEVFVFKTPHHPDYKTDRHVPMVTIGLATAAAPTFFRPLERGGYLLVDGGVWANNPVMLAVIEALTCFTVESNQIDVLTIGGGDDPYIISSRQIRLGGLFFWKDAIFAAMRLQSLAATNQARLLLGPPNVMRLDPPINEKRIELDDWRRAVEGLVPAAVKSVAAKGDMIAEQFLVTPAQPYTPCPE